MLACYVVNTSEEDSSGKKKCGPLLEDYYECLHHKKEVRKHLPVLTLRLLVGVGSRPTDGHVPQHARVVSLQAAYRKAESTSARDNAPNAGQIRNLGLLGKEEDTKKVLGS